MAQEKAAEAPKFDAKVKEAHLADAEGANFRTRNKWEPANLKKVSVEDSLSWSDAKKKMLAWVAKDPTVNVASYSGTYWLFTGTWYTITLLTASGTITMEVPGHDGAHGFHNIGVLVGPKFKFECNDEGDDE